MLGAHVNEMRDPYLVKVRVGWHLILFIVNEDVWLLRKRFVLCGLHLISCKRLLGISVFASIVVVNLRHRLRPFGPRGGAEILPPVL